MGITKSNILKEDALSERNLQKTSFFMFFSDKEPSRKT